MNDKTDLYLARCLKNWAACHQPATEVRSNLLQQAVLHTQTKNFSLSKKIAEKIGVKFPSLRKMNPFLIFDIALLMDEPVYPMETVYTTLNRVQPRLFYLPLELRLLP
jgi:hypothetical protein